MRRDKPLLETTSVDRKMIQRQNQHMLPKHFVRCSKYSQVCSILLFCVLLASGTGCQILGIPSYRSDGMSYGSTADACASADCSEIDCPPTVLPPIGLLPWFSRYRKEEEPEAPPFPRFHPLPTRPMFSPQPGGQNSSSFAFPASANEGIPVNPGYGEFGLPPHEALGARRMGADGSLIDPAVVDGEAGNPPSDSPAGHLPSPK